MQSLTRLASIACRQPYFAPGTALPLSLAPDAATQVLMRQYGILFRPQNGGGELYCRDPSLMGRYAAAQPLAFTVTNNDPYLLNYSMIEQGRLGMHTDSGTPLAQSVFYADNLHDAGGRLLPDFSGSAIALRPARFNQALAAPVSSASVVLVDALGLPAWRQQTPDEPQSVIQLAPRGIPAGRYSLQVDGAQVLDFYLAPQFGARPFAVLAIYPGGPAQAARMPAGCAMIGADGALTAQEYSFQLMPRATVWRYHLFSASLQLGQWQVEASAAGGASAPSFVCTNPDQSQGPWLFESQAPIALAATPDAYRIVLSRPPGPGRTGRGGRKIRLPYARGANLVQPNGDPMGGISDIFVYL